MPFAFDLRTCLAAARSPGPEAGGWVEAPLGEASTGLDMCGPEWLGPAWLTFGASSTWFVACGLLGALALRIVSLDKSWINNALPLGLLAGSMGAFAHHLYTADFALNDFVRLHQPPPLHYLSPFVHSDPVWARHIYWTVSNWHAWTVLPLVTCGLTLWVRFVPERKWARWARPGLMLLAIISIAYLAWTSHMNSVRMPPAPKAILLQISIFLIFCAPAVHAMWNNVLAFRRASLSRGALVWIVVAGLFALIGAIVAVRLAFAGHPPTLYDIYFSVGYFKYLAATLIFLTLSGVCFHQVGRMADVRLLPGLVHLFYAVFFLGVILQSFPQYQFGLRDYRQLPSFEASLAVWNEVSTWGEFLISISFVICIAVFAEAFVHAKRVSAGETA